MFRVDPDLVEAWVCARSEGRGLPQPVPDHGALRVDTATAEENRRYVFAEPSAGLHELGRTIHSPRVLLKLAGSAEEMASLLPPRWEIQSPGFMMIREIFYAGEPAAPPGYRLDASTCGATTAIRISTMAGEVAASGYATEFGGAFVYDRIITQPQHQRRGLGRAVMSALGAARRSNASTEILVATTEGRALYASMSWKVYSSWTTAVIPDHVGA